ncbi:MAG: hypothetical protein ABSC24_14030 [Verrucomicrobiota bacterium]|jgi:hypothetical protein
MMINHQNKPPPLGGFFAVLRERLRRQRQQKAEMMMRLAVNAQVVEVRRQDRSVILDPDPDDFFHSDESTS